VESGRVLWRDIVNATAENMIAMRAQIPELQRTLHAIVQWDRPAKQLIAIEP